MAATSGTNCNQLLAYLPYELIKMNPKVWIGYRDMTALILSVYAKTGLETYAGPDLASFGTNHRFHYSESYFEKATMTHRAYQISLSATWSNDPWHSSPEDRNFHPQNGFRVVQSGSATGKLLAGNLTTWSLLFGTEWMPDLNDAVVFIEDAGAINSFTFDQLYQSLLHQPNADKLRALVLGRFEAASSVTARGLDLIIR